MKKQREIREIKPSGRVSENRDEEVLSPAGERQRRKWGWEGGRETEKQEGARSEVSPPRIISQPSGLSEVQVRTES